LLQGAFHDSLLLLTSHSGVESTSRDRWQVEPSDWLSFSRSLDLQLRVSRLSVCSPLKSLGIPSTRHLTHDKSQYDAVRMQDLSQW